MFYVMLFAFLSFSVLAKHCREFQQVAELLDSKKFIKASRAAGKEMHVALEDINQAKMLAYRFPAFEELGFGKPGGADWHSYESRHPHSVLNGKKVGYEIKNPAGHARLRLDWDPKLGGHFNIEISHKRNGKHENHVLAISFRCGGEKCTESQVKKMAEKMQ